MTFLLVALVVIVSPGPDFALTVRNTLLGGRAGGLATAAGVVTGQATWALAAAAGVAALLVASQPLFVALRIAGAAYLVYLGMQALRRALARRSGADLRMRVAGRAGSPFRQGLLSNLSNPKMPVFFTSLLPQFGSSFAALAGRGAVFAGMTLAWLTLVACAGAMLRIAPVRRALDLATGVVLVALGFRLATEPR